MTYSFKACRQRSERITWRVEDLIGDDKRLDFSRPFMPEGLARTAPLTAMLADHERLALNHIRGHAYLAIFQLVEEVILPFILDHCRAYLRGDDDRARAFLQFAAEEAKHIQLFRTFRADFELGFGHACGVIGPPEAVAASVFAQPPLAVALLTLHIEWMTQSHFLESIEGDEGLDPQFKNLLLHHWMEEHQHAQLDALLVSLLAEEMSHAEIEAALDGYLVLVDGLDTSLKLQASLDLNAVERAIGRDLSPAQRETFLTVQHQANRWTFLGSGMRHPRFLESVEALSPARRSEIEALAARYS